MSRIYKFCPFCGKNLTKNKEGYQSCYCGYINYENARPTATTLILNDKNELLLGTRSINPFKGQWGVIGGFLNKDEDPIVGAIREAKEETGLDIKINDFITIIVGDYVEGDTDEKESYYTFNVYYSAEILGGEMKANDDVAELKFFPLNKLPKIAFQHDQEAVQRFIQMRKT